MQGQTAELGGGLDALSSHAALASEASVLAVAAASHAVTVPQPLGPHRPHGEPVRSAASLPRLVATAV